MPKPLQAACPIPQPTLKQCLLDSAMLAGCLRHCSAKSMRGSKLNFGRSTSQVRSKQTIQGLSKTQSYSSQGAGHAWGEQPLCSPVTCAAPASFGGSLCSNTTGTGQPLQRALGSKDETAQVLLPRHRGSDCSHRLRTAEPHCTEAWLLWWVVRHGKGLTATSLPPVLLLASPSWAIQHHWLHDNNTHPRKTFQEAS